MNEASRTENASLAFTLDGLTGLSEAEASERLARDGRNELPTQEARSFLRIALEIGRAHV